MATAGDIPANDEPVAPRTVEPIAAAPEHVDAPVTSLASESAMATNGGGVEPPAPVEGLAAQPHVEEAVEAVAAPVWSATGGLPDAAPPGDGVAAEAAAPSDGTMPADVAASHHGADANGGAVEPAPSPAGGEGAVLHAQPPADGTFGVPPPGPEHTTGGPNAAHPG